MKSRGIVPRCPVHGDTMREMLSVGAPGWFTCITRDATGGVCGRSDHAKTSASKITLLTLRKPRRR